MSDSVLCPHLSYFPSNWIQALTTVTLRNMCSILSPLSCKYPDIIWNMIFGPAIAGLPDLHNKTFWNDHYCAESLF